MIGIYNCVQRILGILGIKCHINSQPYTALYSVWLGLLSIKCTQTPIKRVAIYLYIYSQFGIKCHGCVGCWSSSYFCARQKTWHSIPNWLYDLQQKTLQFVYSHIWKKEKTKHLTQLQLLWNKLTGRLACNVPLTWTHVRCFCMYWSFGLVDLACQT